MMVQISRSRQRLGLLAFTLCFMVIMLVNYASEANIPQQKHWRGRQRSGKDRVTSVGAGSGCSNCLHHRQVSTSSSSSSSNTSLGTPSFVMPNGDDPDFYGVMFDAGSTGSRVHVFHFVSKRSNPPTLVDELYNFTSIGLSTFAKNPEEGAASLKPLLDAALDFIPAENWSSSPVALKATAGLRLLPTEEAEALLESVYQLFCDSPLHVEAREKSITIMEGTMEGIYIWFTLNFLLGTLGSQEAAEHTVGALDLGGGSTQITFVPQDSATIAEGQDRNYIETFRFLHQKFLLYSHSYLGLGLKEARLQTVKIDHLRINQRNSTTENFFHTSCLPPNTTQTWSFGKSSYKAESASTDAERVYQDCYSVTRKYIKQMRVHSPSTEVRAMRFYAMSYFWARARDLKLVDEHLGGILTVDEIVQASKKVCQTNHPKPFICMDMVFISTLLTKGYRFPADVGIQVTPKIGKYDVSWALGATIDLLHTHWDHLIDEGSWTWTI